MGRLVRFRCLQYRPAAFLAATAHTLIDPSDFRALAASTAIADPGRPDGREGTTTGTGKFTAVTTARWRSSRGWNGTFQGSQPICLQQQLGLWSWPPVGGDLPGQAEATANASYQNVRKVDEPFSVIKSRSTISTTRSRTRSGLDPASPQTNAEFDQPGGLAGDRQSGRVVFSPRCAGSPATWSAGGRLPSRASCTMSPARPDTGVD